MYVLLSVGELHVILQQQPEVLALVQHWLTRKMSCSWAFTVFITLASFTGLGVANSIRDAHLDFKRENASIP